MPAPFGSPYTGRLTESKRPAWSTRSWSVIEGTDVPVASVLLDVATGRTPEEIADRHKLAAAEVRDSISDAANLARTTRLSAPAVTAFAERSDAGRIPVADVVEMAPHILESWATGSGRDEVGELELRAAALYATALVWEQVPIDGGSQDDPARRSIRRALERHDLKLVDDLFRYRRAGSPPRTVDEQLAKWTRFVAQVETGYRDLYEEYTNALGGRDVLEDALSLVSPEGRKRIHPLIQPWDERFANATRLTEHPISATRHATAWQPRRWWWYRLPRAPAPELERTLQALGAPAIGAAATAVSGR